MRKSFLSVWPLFLAISFMMIGQGLQGTLLGVRANIEDFDTLAVGGIMSMYFIGYMLGARFVPTLIRQVGHIRVFAALASLASCTVLFHGLFPNEWLWGFVRAFTGFSFAGLYIVIESWLNNSVDNASRGRMMALYLVILFSSMGMGQYLLMAADPAGMDLFVVVSILVSLALLPVSLSNRPAPQFASAERMSIKQVYQTSPLGLYGAFATGMAGACLFSIGPVFAAQEGLKLAEISNFMAAAIFGAVLMQFPVGWCSDRFDRRRVLIVVAGLASAFALLGFVLTNFSIHALYIAMFLMGGMALTLYGLSSSHTNDHLQGQQSVGASATLIFINGLGAILGPLICTALMNITPSMFFIVLAICYGSIAGFGIYRTFKRASVPLERQSAFVVVPSPTVSLSMDQDTPPRLKSDKAA